MPSVGGFPVGVAVSITRCRISGDGGISGSGGCKIASRAGLGRGWNAGLSSRALFAGILAGFYTSTFSKFGVQATASQSTPSSAYSLALTAGSVNLGQQSYAFNPNTAYAGTVFSGRTGWGGDTHEPVVVPLSGTQLLLSSSSPPPSPAPPARR